MPVQMLLHSSTAYGNAIPHGHYTERDSIVAVQSVVQFPQCNDLLVHILQSHLYADHILRKSLASLLEFRAYVLLRSIRSDLAEDDSLCV